MIRTIINKLDKKNSTIYLLERFPVSTAHINEYTSGMFVIALIHESLKVVDDNYIYKYELLSGDLNAYYPGNLEYQGVYIQGI